MYTIIAMSSHLKLNLYNWTTKFAWQREWRALHYLLCWLLCALIWSSSFSGILRKELLLSDLLACLHRCTSLWLRSSLSCFYANDTIALLQYWLYLCYTDYKTMEDRSTPAKSEYDLLRDERVKLVQEHFGWTSANCCKIVVSAIFQTL